MDSRRNFMGKAMAAVAGLIILPDIFVSAAANGGYRSGAAAKPKLRFALVSDIHYGQPDTDYTANTGNMIKWLNMEHSKNHLDLVIVNGDLVHDRPDLLKEIKNKYLDQLAPPYHCIPGNHDLADTAVWQNVFGYADHYTVTKDDAAFVLANTADTNGKYICPDLIFLKTALEQLKEKKTVFVILHIPPVKWMPDDGFLDCPQVVQLLHAHPNVKAVFHGHDHLLDGVRYTGKLPHFFDAHIGGNWGTDYKGFRIVEVAQDDAIYTYQVNASQNPVLNSNVLK